MWTTVTIYDHGKLHWQKRYFSNYPAVDGVIVVGTEDLTCACRAAGPRRGVSGGRGPRSADQRVTRGQVRSTFSIGRPFASSSTSLSR